MRLRRILTLTAALMLLAAGCGGDDTDVGAGAGGDGTADEVPDRAPDLVGEITEVTPREDDERIGIVLVEEQPGVQEGRKISFTVTNDTVITGSDAEGDVEGFDDLAEGQRVESWTAGDVCAESYPEQCGAEALRVIEQR